MFSQDKTNPQITHKLLIVLSVVDVIYLLVSMLIWQPIHLFDCECLLRWPIVRHIIGVLMDIFECFRNWVVVLIGVERIVVVWFPLRSKVWSNERLTDRLLAACFGFKLLVSFHLICYLVIENTELPIIS
ncbi:unnamed protein product [Dibothriocephalus latus]|uniref:G-protein coupled receptors family 1 profile domain-containing protein n=1 Tax=Dibothriocephalus latus TaxID=60516 RepID=A0A3P6SRT2_DIBLA|nr:unnamed protein product [Dibothriocephalus latus]